MKIIFFGTPTFAAEVLQYLLDQGTVLSAVVTQPDRPKGRSLQTTPSPVKSVVSERAPHIPLFQPEKASEASFLQTLADVQADLYVVVAYGQILSQNLLDIPSLGCINVHASLLPKYRGAAPIQRCLLAGEKETGISIQKMVRKMDAGDVICSSKLAITPDMTFGELEEHLMNHAKPLLLQVIREYEKRIPSATPQDSHLATYAAKIELEEGEIHWARSAQDLHNLIRAFSPRPGAWCWVRLGVEKKRLKILRTRILPSQGIPAQLLPDGSIACGQDALQLIEVQPEGKKVMSAADWLRGQKNILFGN